MASFGLYRTTEVKVNFGAVELKDARADTFLNITADEEAFLTIKGSDGAITRYATGNELFHVEYTCKRSSNDNQVLSELHRIDKRTPGGAGVASFSVKDAQGATILVATKAWIQGTPDATSAKDVGGDVTWMFDMQLPDGYVLGGNQL